MSRAHLLRPRVILPHIHDITPEFLDGHGLKGLLLDLDNTLIPYGSYDERSDVLHWASALQAGGYTLYLLSNATRERARIWAERLGLQGVGLAGKPFSQGYRRGLSAVGLPAHQVAMVGDQLFTDVLGGNWSGMFTIMVSPISDNALPHTRFTRKLERIVLKRYGHDWAGKVQAAVPLPKTLPLPTARNSFDTTLFEESRVPGLAADMNGTDASGVDQSSDLSGIDKSSADKSRLENSAVVASKMNGRQD